MVKKINFIIKVFVRKKKERTDLRHLNFPKINWMFLKNKKQKTNICTAKMSKFETNIFHKRRPRGMQVSGSHQRNAS